MIFNKVHISKEMPSDYDVINKSSEKTKEKRKRPFRYESDY